MKVPTNDMSFDEDDDLRVLMNRTEEATHAQKSNNRPKYNPVINCCVTGIAYIHFFWIHHRTEFILTLILLTAVTLAVTGVIEAYESGQDFKPRKHNIANDYSGIKSDLELKLGQIDHYCFDGGDQHCPRCEDPTKPNERYAQEWLNIYHRNKKLAKDYLEVHGDNVFNIDVVFLGDSNTEARTGTFKGLNGEGKMEDVLHQSKLKFEKFFSKAQGGKYDGLALGIAGDSSPNLLWRVQRNEFHDLSPRVWWINIGINDLLSNYCSEEITIMGILRVVEEFIYKQDGATIVINSVLPVATHSNLALDGKHIHNKYWPAIKEVNRMLQKFAKKHDGVRFFNTDEILTMYRGKNLYMKKIFFTDKVHLSAAGQEALAEAQADFITSIYEKDEADKNKKYRNIDTTPAGKTNAVADQSGAVDGSNESELKIHVDIYGNELDEYGYLMDDSDDDFLPDWNRD